MYVLCFFQCYNRVTHPSKNYAYVISHILQSEGITTSMKPGYLPTVESSNFFGLKKVIGEPLASCITGWPYSIESYTNIDFQGHNMNYV